MADSDVTVTTHASDGTITTTTTTTKRSKTHTTITIDIGYLVPHGILKILEMVFCIIVFSLIASVQTVFGTKQENTRVYPPIAFPFAIAIVFFITTFILLIFFVFSLPEHTCGRKSSNYLDAIHNVIAVLLLFVCFVLLCCYCDYDYVYSTNGNTSFSTRKLIIDELVVAAIFAMAAAILYVMSLFFAARSGKVPMITVRT